MTVDPTCLHNAEAGTRGGGGGSCDCGQPAAWVEDEKCGRHKTRKEKIWAFSSLQGRLLPSDTKTHTCLSCLWVSVGCVRLSGLEGTITPYVYHLKLPFVLLPLASSYVRPFVTMLSLRCEYLPSFLFALDLTPPPPAPLFRCYPCAAAAASLGLVRDELDGSNRVVFGSSVRLDDPDFDRHPR